NGTSRGGRFLEGRPALAELQDRLQAAGGLRRRPALAALCEQCAARDGIRGVEVRVRCLEGEVGRRGEVVRERQAVPDRRRLFQAILGGDVRTSAGREGAVRRGGREGPAECRAVLSSTMPER